MAVVVSEVATVVTIVLACLLVVVAEKLVVITKPEGQKELHEIVVGSRVEQTEG